MLLQKKRKFFFVSQLEQFKAEAEASAVFEAEWVYAGLLKKLGWEEQKKTLKTKLLEQVEKLAINEYLKMNYLKRIQEL